MPCTSAKKGGGGIGLAISKQLAQSLGAKLELTGTSSSGCNFRLILPQPAERAIRPATNEPFLAMNIPDQVSN
jgi:signal transduction histidine kinase